MDDSMIAPELRGRVRWIPTLAEQTGFSRWLGRKITRMMPSAKVADVAIKDRRQARGEYDQTTPRRNLFQFHDSVPSKPANGECLSLSYRDE